MLFVGDLGYTTPEDWFAYTDFLNKSKVFIAIGNHDLPKKNYLDFYDLQKPFYSFEINNVYFISISIKTISEQKISLWRLVLFAGVPILMLAISPDLSSYSYVLTERFNTYNEVSLLTSSSDSIGVALIINQPIYIRIFT